MNYQLENANVIDRWCLEGWIWGQAITHEIYSQAAGRGSGKSI